MLHGASGGEESHMNNMANQFTSSAKKSPKISRMEKIICMTSLKIIAIVGHFTFTYLIRLQARQEGKYHPYLL